MPIGRKDIYSLEFNATNDLIAQIYCEINQLTFREMYFMGIELLSANKGNYSKNGRKVASNLLHLSSEVEKVYKKYPRLYKKKVDLNYLIQKYPRVNKVYTKLMKSINEERIQEYIEQKSIITFQVGKEANKFRKSTFSISGFEETLNVLLENKKEKKYENIFFYSRVVEKEIEKNKDLLLEKFCFHSSKITWKDLHVFIKGFEQYALIDKSYYKLVHYFRQLSVLAEECYQKDSSYMFSKNGTYQNLDAIGIMFPKFSEMMSEIRECLDIDLIKEKSLLYVKNAQHKLAEALAVRSILEANTTPSDFTCQIINFYKVLEQMILDLDYESFQHCVLEANQLFLEHEKIMLEKVGVSTSCFLNAYHINIPIDEQEVMKRKVS